MGNNKIKTDSHVKIQTNSIHQETQKPLDGMHGSVCGLNTYGEWIISVAELNGVKLPFSEEELILIEGTHAFPF
jgi:xanthine dehydrogenase iron-sulfur cluster and FAD-binding subunit A